MIPPRGQCSFVDGAEVGIGGFVKYSGAGGRCVVDAAALVRPVGGDSIFYHAVHVAAADRSITGHGGRGN